MQVIASKQSISYFLQTSKYPTEKTEMKSQVDRQLKEAKSLYTEGKEKHASGDYAAAQKSFGAALQIQEVILGKYHQDTIKSYWRCGRAACLANDDSAALEAFQRAARMAETSFDKKVNERLWKEIRSYWGKTHDESDKSLEQMGAFFELEHEADLHCKNRQFSKAIECYQRALAIQDSLTGADSLDGADIRCKLACCFLRLSNLQEAESVLNTAHECFMKRFGEQHPATLGAAAGIKNVKTRGMKLPLNRKASLSSLGSSSKRATANA